MKATTWVITVASDLAVFYLLATNGHGDARRIGPYESFDAAEDAIPDAPPVHLWHRSFLNFPLDTILDVV